MNACQDLSTVQVEYIQNEKQILQDITYMWNLKNNTNESICKIETDSQTQKTNLGLPKGKGRGEV